MSLSDLTPVDLALVERVLPWNNSLSHYTDFRCGRDDLANLLAAARAEGVAALQQAGEPVAWRWQQVEIEAGREWVTTEYDDEPPAPHLEYVREVTPLYASPLPQQTALVEEGVEKILAPHEPAACGASAPSEPPRFGGGEG